MAGRLTMCRTGVSAKTRPLRDLIRDVYASVCVALTFLESRKGKAFVGGTRGICIAVLYFTRPESHGCAFCTRREE